jgi:hypothetical protein
MYYYSVGQLKVYHLVARWIPLAVNPFIDLTRVIYAGIEVDTLTDIQ